MLTMKAQYSLQNAESYFREHLGVGDYYMEGRSVSGQWMGEGARELGLSGVTTEKDFLNLCRNIHPRTDEQLTPRLNSKRVRVAIRQDEAVGQLQTAKQNESAETTETIRPAVQKSETTRRRIQIPPKQNNQKSKGMRV